MRYVPKPKHLIVQAIEEEAPKKSLIIQLNEEKQRYEGKILALGPDIDFLEEGGFVLYNKYSAILLDEKEGLYSLPVDGVICGIEKAGEE